MIGRLYGQPNLAAISLSVLAPSGMLQRKCACGGTPGPTGECAACRRKRQLGGTLQPKLRINQPGDRYEREADWIAGQVMRMPEPGLQRQADAEEEEELLQTKSVGQGRAGGDMGAQAEVPPIVQDTLRSPGRPLDLSTRQFMESRFGHNFSQVRVHTNTRAAESARAINARGYTVGQHVVFGRGEYAPGTSTGKHLLAHELTHTVQQGNHPGYATPDTVAQRAVDEPHPFRPSSLSLGPEEPARASSPFLAGELPPRGESLPFREATELVRCIRILGEGGEPPTCTPDQALEWDDYTATPPSHSNFKAWTRPDIRRVSYSPPGGLCRHLVLGEPLDIRFKFQAFLDNSASWVQPSTRNASDPSQNGCDQVIAQCQNHFTNVPPGRTAGPFRLSTPGGCPAAVSYPATAVANSLSECSSVLMPACIQREEAESARILSHEQVHFDIGCVLAQKANTLLATGADEEAVLRRARALLQPLHNRYDTQTQHGCRPGPQATWEQRVTNGLPSVTLRPQARRHRRRRRRR